MKKPPGITIDVEPCPACHGAGIRLVPPPVGPRGGPVGSRHKGKTHGKVSTYSAGCRCDLCRAGWREYKHILKARKISDEA